MMATYHINQATNAQIIQHLRDMDDVLTEVAVTYELLGDLLERHADALSVPAVDARRTQLLTDIRQLQEYSATVAKAVQEFTEGSERVTTCIQTRETAP